MLSDRLDHLLCYKARKAKGEKRFELSGVQLENQFDQQPRTVDISKLQEFCDPVEITTINGQSVVIPIVNPDAHLTCYRVRQPKPLIKAQVISTSDEIGGQRELDVRKRRKTQLCVPSWNIGDSPPNLDYFDRYRTKRTWRAPKFERLQVGLKDPFTNLDEIVELKKPVEFGVPTDKDGDGIIDPFAHLTCYSVRAPKFTRRDVIVENQFGRFPLTVKKPYKLCVPSSKQVITLEP
jgi:hypothetical protein